MRNKNYKDDQKVFAFINDNCKSFWELREFLRKNNLPLLERWGFYYLGKHSEINKEAIDKISTYSHNSYGGYIKAEIYHWNKYLLNEVAEKRNITEYPRLTSGKIIEGEELENLFIKHGWLYVQSKMAEDERKSDPNYRDDYDTSGSSYCGACQSSPCMCSDREKSSTIHDF